MDRKALPVLLVALALAAISGAMGLASLLLTDITAQRFSPAREVAGAPSHDGFRFAYSQVERSLLGSGMVDLGNHAPQVRVDLVYAGSRHWGNMPLYGNLKRAFLQPAVADMLVAAAGFLAASDSALRLVVLDAARPVSLEQNLYSTAAGEAAGRLETALRYGPSMHTYGCAVDVALARGDSLLGHPEMIYQDPVSAACRYAEFSGGEGLAVSGELRQLLQAAMRRAGFRDFAGAWWHFEAYGPAYTRRNFLPVP